MSPSVLFLSTRPEKPSHRFRVAPFLAPLAEHGWTARTAFLPPSWLRRRALWRREVPAHDVVVVQKRLLGRLDLRALRRRARRLVFDLDDAIMYRDDRAAPDPKRLARFRAMARAADLVVAGNAWLADQARQAGAARVETIPTVVDTDLYRPAARSADGGPITVGWSGSSSTNRYLTELLGGLGTVPARSPWRFLAVSNARPDGPADLRLDFEPWAESTEVGLLQSFDVGLMPLDDTPWSRGKCGLKALLTQAVGAPIVCSPVGVNPEIVADGETGFLAGEPAEWTDRLARLIDDADLRRRMGEAGRRRVIERYSVRAALPRLATALESIR